MALITRTHLPYKFSKKGKFNLGEYYNGDNISHSFFIGGNGQDKADKVLTTYKNGTVIYMDLNHGELFTNSKELLDFLTEQ